MKTKILIVGFMIIVTSMQEAIAQVERYKSVVDAAIQQASASSVNRRVDWEKLRTEMYSLSQEAKSVHELQSAFQAMFATMKDRNAIVYNTTDRKPIATFPAYQDSETLTGEPKTPNTPFSYSRLEEGACYLRIGTVENPLALAQTIRSAIDSLAKGDATRWVVDLRSAYNMDIKTLLSGTGPLLGEGLVATTTEGKKLIDLLSVHNGKLYINQVQQGAVTGSLLDLSTASIAILVDENTSGGGEALAMSLGARKNTKTFGSATAGKISGVKSFTLPGGLTMEISAITYGDRKGNYYTASITPDVAIETEMGEDAALNEAVRWLSADQVAVTKLTN